MAEEIIISSVAVIASLLTPKLTAFDVAAEAVEATLSSKSYCIPGKRYRAIVFFMKYTPFIMKLLSNTLSGGRYAKK